MCAGDDGAVARGRRVHEVRGLEPARARHVLDDDARIAGDVIFEYLYDQPRRGVVGAAGGGADDEADLLALVEVVLRPSAKRAREEREPGSSHNPAKTHDVSPWAPC